MSYQTPQTPPAANETKLGTVTLSNGKKVVLSAYGWHQPESQYDAHGFLSADECSEAWAAWDAALEAQAAVQVSR